MDVIGFRKFVAERQNTESEYYSQNNHQPQPMPEVGEEKLA